MRGVNLDDYDKGLIGIIREIVVLGENKVTSQDLLERGFSIKGLSSMMMRSYDDYSVCYMKDKETDLYELFAIARISR